LSIEVTLLLQSNREEIKRISFVQHYKRKVVESLQGYDLIEASYDVIKLLNGLK
jgi:hypothetical protein